MKRANGVRMASLLAALLVLSGVVQAGPYVNLMQPCDCPPNHYSGFHVLTPRFYRWAAFCQGPRCYIFAPIQYPNVAPVPFCTKYHCPSINPYQFSVVNYPGLNGQIPASVYQSPPKSPAAPIENPPQLLAPPRIEKPAEKLPPPREDPEKK